MTVREIQNILSAEVVCGGDCLDREVNDACGSDMMSDVLAFVNAWFLCAVNAPTEI